MFNKISYELTNSFCSQGFTVSLLYCFFNNEVQNTLKYHMIRWKAERSFIASRKKYDRSWYMLKKNNIWYVLLNLLYGARPLVTARLTLKSEVTLNILRNDLQFKCIFYHQLKNFMNSRFRKNSNIHHYSSNTKEYCN